MKVLKTNWKLFRMSNMQQALFYLMKMNYLALNIHIYTHSGRGHPVNLYLVFKELYDLTSEKYE